MSYTNRSVFKAIESRLRTNEEARLKRGALVQDFECLPGEVFYGNLKQADFDALPLRTKRKAGPAYATRIFSETRENTNCVFTASYEKLYGDKESFAVFVHTYELDMLGIQYKF